MAYLRTDGLFLDGFNSSYHSCGGLRLYHMLYCWSGERTLFPSSNFHEPLDDGGEFVYL